MPQTDFKYLNIPALLERKAWIAAGSQDNALVEDSGWTKRLSERLSSLVFFFRSQGLLKNNVREDISDLVLCFSDFTDEGKQLIKSGAPDKWLASFDSNPTKSSSDVSYLSRKLEAIRRAKQRSENN